MNAATNLPAERRELKPIDQLKNIVARRADEFAMVLPSHIGVEKFQRTIATAALSNPQLLDCDRQSLLVASMKLAQDGLLPDGREAALVPFKKWDPKTRQTTWLVQPMPMAYGLRKKVLQSGEVISLQVGVVYLAEVENGNFIYEIGIDPPIRHRPKLDMTEEEMADDQLVAAYSIARIKNPDGEAFWSVEVMRRAEVLKVRQASQTGALGKTDRNGKPIPPKGPWVEWEPEMWKKTVMRRHSKVLPMSGDIIETFARDEAEERSAESAARMLSHEADGSRVLPSNRELAEQQGEPEDTRSAAEYLDDEIPDHNAETGELVERDSRGMSEVDEETARELDSQTDADEADQAGDEQQSEVREPWRDKVDEIEQMAASARNLADLKKADAEFQKHAAAFPDQVARTIDGMLATRRKKFAK